MGERWQGSGMNAPYRESGVKVFVKKRLGVSLRLILSFFTKTNNYQKLREREWIHADPNNYDVPMSYK